MKKIIFILFVTTCLLQISCSNQSKVDSVNESDTLEYLNQNLPSFANIQSIYEFSKDSSFVRFNIKEHVVCFYDKKNMITVLDFKGKRIGDKFDSFTIIKANDSSSYYLGTNYKFKYYYFPENEYFITPKRIFQTPDEICFITQNNEVVFYTFDGKYKWQTSLDGYLIHLQNKSENTFFIAKENSLNFDTILMEKK